MSNHVTYLKGAAGERALVARMVAGQEAAFRECYELYAPRLLRLLERLLRHAPLAEDVLQESFFAAFTNIASFRGDARLSTWLCGIAYRRGFNARRGERRRLRNLPPPAEGPSPEYWLGERDVAGKVMLVLGSMEPRKQDALILQAEGYTAAEIATITGEPRGTILSRLARARSELGEKVVAAGLIAQTGGERGEQR